MTRRLPSTKKLKPLLDRAGGRYPELKKGAESAVVRWLWATDRVRSLRPGFDAKIKGFPEGKELPAKPSRVAYKFQYGLDAEGRPVVVRLHGEFAGHFTESFFVHGDGKVLEWSYGSDPDDKEPTSVGCYQYHRGRIVAFSELAEDDDDSVAERFEYDAGGRLSTLQRLSGHPRTQEVYRHQYDASGALHKVTLNGDRGVVYQRPARSPAALSKAVRARLLELIPQRVAALRIKGPAFCLALIYDPGNSLSMLPPKLAVGLEAERARWRKSGGDKSSLWNAQRFTTFDDQRLELDDAELLADSDELCEQLRDKGDLGRAHAILVEVARALNKVDFGKSIVVTPDFVVYCVDLHVERLAKDLAAAIPSARLKRLKARGEI